ncbi:unnamed protein product, partial [Trichogramma brassicae]
MDSQKCINFLHESHESIAPQATILFQNCLAYRSITQGDKGILFISVSPRSRQEQVI